MGSIPEIFQETQPNKEKSGKMPSHAADLKHNPLVLSGKNLHDQEEEEECLRIIRKEWIKIGDEYLQNPVAIISQAKQAFIKEFVADPLFESRQNDKSRKRKFEADSQEVAVYTYFVPDPPGQTEIEIPINAFIKNRRYTLKEKYVRLHVINRLFMSKKEGEEEEEEEKDLASPFSFRTKRKYLYYES